MLAQFWGWFGFAAASVYTILDHAVRVAALVWLYKKWRDEEAQGETR
jgi:hypothetical protein